MAGSSPGSTLRPVARPASAVNSSSKSQISLSLSWGRVDAMASNLLRLLKLFNRQRERFVKVRRVDHQQIGESIQSEESRIKICRGVRRFCPHQTRLQSSDDDSQAVK